MAPKGNERIRIPTLEKELNLKMLRYWENWQLHVYHKHATCFRIEQLYSYGLAVEALSHNTDLNAFYTGVSSTMVGWPQPH